MLIRVLCILLLSPSHIAALQSIIRGSSGVLPRARPVLRFSVDFSEDGLSTWASSSGTVHDGAADGCLVPEIDEDHELDDFEASAEIGSILLTVAPVILPIVAAAYFPAEVAAVHNFLDFISTGKWFEVDGGQSRTAALLPVLTGIVLPSVSFALGTLTASTISTLRARQVTLRTALNSEACLVRSVLSATESLFPRSESPHERERAALLLRQYCSRVILESRRGIDLELLAYQGAANSELDALTRLLHHAPAIGQPNHLTGAPPVRQRVPRFEGTTEFMCQMYLEKLQLTRSERLAVLQTTFPAMHWRTLMLLGFSIVFGFLLAADQQTLLFLAPTALQTLYAIIVGALVATACICIDLADPFGGAFQITPSSKQLVVIRDLVDQTLCYSDSDEEQHVPLAVPESAHAAAAHSQRAPRRQ